MFILHSANICVFSCGNYLSVLLWDMSGDIHALRMYPLRHVWEHPCYQHVTAETCLGTATLSTHSSDDLEISVLKSCECFSEGVASSPELWLMTGDKLVWLQVSFEWEGSWAVSLGYALVLCSTWRHVRRPGSNWIQSYRKNYFQECFNRWLLHNHSHTCLHIICRRMHHRTYTPLEPLLKQGFLLLSLCALQASWSTAFWLILLPLPPIFSEESWIIDACFHAYSSCEFWRPNSGLQAWAGITCTHQVICQPRFWDFSHFVIRCLFTRSSWITWYNERIQTLRGS